LSSGSPAAKRGQLVPDDGHDAPGCPPSPVS
jgi:hypothetical protein